MASLEAPQSDPAERDPASMTRTEMWDELARLDAENAAEGGSPVTADDLPALEAEARRRGLEGRPRPLSEDLAMTPDETLSPTEVRLIAAIVEAPAASQADIAKAIDLSARHVRRLLARERVRKALDDAARAGLAAGASVLGRGAQRAAEALLAMAMGTARATAPRVQACRAVLDGAGRLIDLVDLERRIAGLENGPAARSRFGGVQ